MEHKHDDIRPSGERDERHELLCAYVLGEASAEERERIEAELAADPELRAERERLESTIGLVKAFGEPAPELSESARQAVHAAGEDGPGLAPILTLPWYRKPAFRVAALALVAVGAAFAIAPYLDAPTQHLGEATDVATPGKRGNERTLGEVTQETDNARDLRRGELSSEEKDLLDALGYSLDGSAQPVPRSVSRFSEPRDEEEASALAVLEEKSRGDVSLGMEVLGYGAPSEGEAQYYMASAPEGALKGTTENFFRGAGDTVPPEDSASVGLIELGYQGGSGQTQVAFDAEHAQQLRSIGYVSGTPKAPSEVAAAREGAGGGGGSFAGRHGGVAKKEGPAAPASPMVQPSGPPSAGFFHDDGGASSAPDDSAVPARAEDPSYERVADLVDAPGQVLRHATPMTGDPGSFLGQGKKQEDQRGRRIALTELEVDLDGVAWSNYDELGEDPYRAAERELLQRAGLEDSEAALRDLLQSLGYLPQDFAGSLEDPEVLEIRRKLVELEVARKKVDALLESCCRRPGESVKDMFFRHWGTRPAVVTAEDPLSTFSIDVDTASYTLARGMLDRGILPTRDQVRAEEFVNYFDAEVRAPAEGTFRLASELAPNPFGPANSWLLRAVVKAKDVSDAERDSLALTFVVDVSGSMATDNRIELAKSSMRQLLTKLDGNDRVAILAFSRDCRVVLPPTAADQRGRIEAAILSLDTGGGTNVQSGLVRGYELAADGFDPELQNRVVLLSDGVGNIGETDQQALLDQVAGQRNVGVYLNTIGFGISNHNDLFLEQLANNGDGVCNYVDTPVEAHKAFVENFTGAFQTVARDVKIQVEFDASKVGRYRLIGYENRAIADREFRNDKVDAGEVGAGQEVVAVYELFDVNLSGDGEESLGTFRVRFKQPHGSTQGEAATEISAPLALSGAAFAYEGATTGFKKSTLVAQVAEVLRRSWHATGDSFDRLSHEITALAAQTPDADFREFAALFERNRAAIEAQVKPASEVQGWMDELKYLRYELEREREAEGTPKLELIASLEQRIQALERSIREQVLAQAEPPQRLRQLGYIEER